MTTVYYYMTVYIQQQLEDGLDDHAPVWMLLVAIYIHFLISWLPVVRGLALWTLMSEYKQLQRQAAREIAPAEKYGVQGVDIGCSMHGARDFSPPPCTQVEKQVGSKPKKLVITEDCWCLRFAAIFLDSFISPLFQIVIGSFFLATSTTIEDVILNTTALAYVTQIDDIIVGLAISVHGSREFREGEINPPAAEGELYNRARKFFYMTKASECFVLWVPLVPFGFALAVLYASGRWDSDA